MSSVIISGLSHQAANDPPLFLHLDLTFSAERTGLVGRNGVGKSTLLKLISGEWPIQSGHIHVSGTLGVLRQPLQTGNDTLADLFEVREALSILRRAEAGLADEDDLTNADWTLEARIEAALAEVGLSITPETALSTLSGGQRTRAAVAALVFRDPEFLLLDEPTNNLDQEGRQAVHDLIGRWRKGAIIVSHDRELLEQMDAIVELTTLGAARYGGNWSQYKARKAAELASAKQQLSDAEKRIAEVARDTQTTAERQARRDGAGKRKAAKGDMPKILMGMRKDRSEQTGGAQARLAEGMKAEATESISAAREKIEVLQPLNVTIAPTGLPEGRTVVRLETVRAGYGEAPILVGVSFVMGGPERVAVTGANGSGKTTLLSVITGRLAASEGTVWVTPDTAFLDQQVSLLDPALSIRDNFRHLHPEADENACRAALARFMFRADSALQIVGNLSGGQMLRAGLACVLGGEKPPSLLILDEPTNHLDIDAIEAVEAGLRAYDGALLVVSHDDAFLDNIGITRRISITDMKNP